MAKAFFPSNHTYTESDIATLWNEGSLTLGAPVRFDSMNADGPDYSENYSYSLTYKGRAIAVLHIHYNSNDSTSLRTAQIGQVKLKQSDWGSLLDRGAPATMIAAARAKHPAPAPVCPHCGVVH
jgi:hypothetical protein